MDYALDNPTTQMLIDHLHANEIRAIEQFRYSNPQSRLNDLKDCGQAYQIASSLLKEENNQPINQNDKQMVHVWCSARAGIRFSYETIKNLQLRSEFLQKVQNVMNRVKYDKKTKSYYIKDEDHDLDPDNTVESYYDKVNKIVSTWAQKTSKTWGSAVSTQLKDFNDFLNANRNRVVTLEKCIAKYATEDQLSVLEYMQVFGSVLTVFTLGVILWGVLENKNPAVPGAEAMVGIGGALAGGEVGEAIILDDSFIFGWTVELAGTTVSGILGGVIGSFLGGLAAVSLFNAMMEIFIYSPQLNQLTDNLFCEPQNYELTLPDNEVLSSTLVQNVLKGGG